VAKVGTSKVGGTISQQAAVHPWLAADAHGNKQTNIHVQMCYKCSTFKHHNMQGIITLPLLEHNKPVSSA
jgi:hypothetical protein